MSWRTTAVLFVILLALGGYIYYQNQQEPETVTETEPVGTLPPPTPERFSLIRTTLENVQGLNVTHLEDGTQAQFLREEQGAWAQTVPTTTQVISQTMETYMTGIINMQTTRSFAGDENPLSTYGLDAPAYNISIAAFQDDISIVRITLLIGNKTPTGSSYYVQLDGDPRVHLAPIGPIDNMINLIDNPPLIEQ